jgi:uncharacterized membrane protein YphA (DoxX/SURF4 family)
MRLALGLSFFYLGWSAVFDHTLGITLRTNSLPSLYAWLSSSAAPFAGVPATGFAWAFLVLGACITLGLFTRFASLLMVVLILAALLPAINFAHFSPGQFVNDEVIALFALMVLIFSKAGTYFGADKLVRRARRKKEF